MNPNIAPEPDERGTIDASNIKKNHLRLSGHGHPDERRHPVYGGNKNTYQNFDTVATLDGKLTDIDFTLNYVVAVTDGNLSTPASAGLYDQMRDNMAPPRFPCVSS